MLRYFILFVLYEGIHARTTTRIWVPFSNAVAKTRITKRPEINLVSTTRKVAAFPQYWYADNQIEVVLKSDVTYKKNKEHIDEDFQKVFNDFAKEEGFHFNQMNFMRESYLNDRHDIRKFRLKGVNCERFKDFLLRISPSEYRIEQAIVSCGQMKYTICKTFSCSDDIFSNTTGFYI